MSHPFDATLKDILGQSAADLTPVLHLPDKLPVRPLNIDLSTVSAATDLAYGFGDPLEEIVDINFQSGPDTQLDGRLLLYNAAYHHHHPVPIWTILMLLRPAADHTRLTGRLDYQSGGSRVEFQYEVVRLWQQPVDLYLAGGLALLPLAPLCQLPVDVPVEEAIRTVIHLIDQRLEKEATYASAMKLMSATFVLAGMRLQRQVLTDVFRGVKIMFESSSAFEVFEEKGRQAGLQEGRKEGRVEEIQRVLLRLGNRRYGAPDAASLTKLQSLQDIDRLERLSEALLNAQGWQELLATP